MHSSLPRLVQHWCINQGTRSPVYHHVPVSHPAGLPVIGSTSVCRGNLYPKSPTVSAFEKATAMGLKLHTELEASQAQIAFVGRVGSDFSEYGLKYSHMGVVVKNHPKGKWIFSHLLNHCGSSESALYDEGLITFFMDAPFAYEAIIIIPSKAMQTAMQRKLENGWGERFHEAKYNTIANPFSTRYQNSNQWLLELIAASNSLYSVNDRNAAQQLLKQTRFNPDYVQISGGKRLGASLFKRNIYFDDHSEQTQQSERYPLVTVRSVARYLRLTDVAQTVKEIRLEATDMNLLKAQNNSVPAVISNIAVRDDELIPNSKIKQNQDVLEFWTKVRD